MKIYIASDHGGFNLKEELKKYLQKVGHEVEDFDNKSYESEDDYPDFVFPLAEKVAAEPESLGVVLGRSGNGEAMAANKVKGIRAALCLNETMAKKAREHNDANVLALGADYIDEKTAKEIVETFIKTPFSEEERHKRRIEKISSYETS